MGVQAIDQTIFSLGIGKGQSVLLPSGNRTLSSFPIPRGKYCDLLPALPLNNCILLPNKVYFSVLLSQILVLYIFRNSNGLVDLLYSR